ncbi:CorA family divalent cation transporter [Aureimonas endophytica]|uniref:CorA family divalent cation transporter n=1 Tax=Aureimonas endophytica TaxID=2027858 RepID=UPI001664A855
MSATIPCAPWIKDAAFQRLESVERDIGSLSEYEARTEAEIAYLQHPTLGLVNIEQNTIIKVLPIAAVLFLPPTLVGTIYGMNFEPIPNLSWRIGYPMPLGMMIVSAAWWFRRKCWLDQSTLSGLDIFWRKVSTPFRSTSICLVVTNSRRSLLVPNDPDVEAVVPC